ncbi:MAG TPA: energy transducer TonB [Vicinamibacterales bacterium]|nr:energy transducer TonB [Vicinamibacterales bacterium]
MKNLLVALFVLGAASPVAGQAPAFSPGVGAARSDVGSIDAARELYATARYDEALALLNGLRPGEGTPASDLKTIEQYRSLCLLALGRPEEAETAIAAVVTVDPFFAPTESEASPRVRAAFSDVRSKLLPGIALSRYTSAKQAFDRKEHAAASRMFRELVILLDDPQMNGRLGDLRLLAGGFLELATAAAAPPPEPKPEPKPEPAPRRDDIRTAPAAPAIPRVYGADEPGIIAPVPLRQQVPNIPAAIIGMTKERGMLEITVDEQGRVVAIALRSVIHPLYDSLLMTAARDWKYRPATLNGAPVRFKKLIQIALPRR